MTKVKVLSADSDKSQGRMKPADNPADRENQMIALAINVAEQQLIDGTASAQVITHFLKLGTSNNQLEKEKLENDIRLLQAKVEALEASKDAGERYAAALEAMQKYSGKGSSDDTDEY